MKKSSFSFVAIFLAGLLVWSFTACGGETSTNTNQATNSEPPLTLDTVATLLQGQRIVSAASIALQSELQAAIQRGGVKEALSYCNVEAIPVMSRISSDYKAEIRRTSEKYRNPKDAPTEVEQAVLADFEAQSGARQIRPQIRLFDDQSIGFCSPIRINANCLQCHGKIGEDIKDADYALIKELYPDDLAFGYAVGDIRGMWSVKMPGFQSTSE